MAGKRSDWSLFGNLNPHDAEGRMAWGIIIFVVAGLMVAVAIVAPKLLPGNLLSIDYFSKRRAEQVITSMLVDPDSARFRNLVAVRTPGDGTLVCGEVNSRNRLGGFSGFSRFVVSHGTGQAAVEPEDAPSEKQMYSDQYECERASTDEDKSLYCERSKRSTAAYEAAELYRELAKVCAAG